MIASDLIVEAYAKHYAALIDTLWHITHDKSVIILVVELRAEGDLKFFSLLQEHGFKYERLSDDKLSPQWRADEIRIFLLKKNFENDDLYK